MSVDRPTFNENWHRVEGVRPKLRSAVQVFRQHFRGQPWHVLRDASGGKFFRVSAPAYHFVALLDGRRTVGEAWSHTCETLGDDAPTQGEALQLLGELHTSNLLTAEVSPDTAALLERQSRRRQRELRGQLTNILFLKIPIFDPDRLLDLCRPFMGWTFGPVGLVLWALLLIAGGWSLVGSWDELTGGAQSVLSADNLLWLYLAFAATKAVHEMGHGIACKQLGIRERAPGEVHTLGVMLLVLMPVPYVDASSSSAFRNKWRRAWVGAAGMYYEFAMAAVAAIIWSRTAQDSVLHDVAYNVMFIASVTTVLFNANPLIRFDGYYILSDLLEIPNLNQRSREHLLYLVRTHGFGVRRLIRHVHNGFEAWFFIVYGVASAMYRVFLMITITLFVAGQLFFIGPILAIGALFTAFVMPTGKIVWYLLQNPELARTRPRAMAISAAVAAVIVVCVGLLPLPERSLAEGVVEPREQVDVHAEVAGFVVEAAPSGVPARAGEGVLVRMESPELDARIAEKRATRRSAQAELVAARGADRATVQVMTAHINAIDREIERLLEQRDALLVRPPADGAWVCPHIDTLPGRFAKRGEVLGAVASLDQLVVRATALQALGPRLREEATGRAWIRPHGRPDVEILASIERVFPAATRELPSQALGVHSGGGVAVAQAQSQDPAAGPQAESNLFLVVLSWPDETHQAAADQRVADPDHADDLAAAGVAPFAPGQRVIVRFDMGSAPLVEQVWRFLRQLLQRRLNL